MAPRRIPQGPNYPFIPDPSRIPGPSPQAYGHKKAYLPPKDFQRGDWLFKAEDNFHQFIRWAEGQPSNGTVRRVDRPNGETRFTVAYGNGPDRELHILLECIHAKHGEVSLRHDGRDSTGKHWIKCFGELQPGSSVQQREVAIICVSSKLEDATIPRPPCAKGKGKEPRYAGGVLVRPMGLMDRMRAGDPGEGWERLSGREILKERERERQRRG